MKKIFGLAVVLVVAPFLLSPPAAPLAPDRVALIWEIENSDEMTSNAIFRIEYSADVMFEFTNTETEAIITIIRAPHPNPPFPAGSSAHFYRVTYSGP